MITDQDRSFYIGASDTAIVMGNWGTKTFEKWWLKKQSFDHSTFTTEAMMAGTYYERPILESLGIWNMEYDKQVIIGRLRVNLDGNTPDKIYECKTFRAEKGFKVSKAYREQVNVEMYATGIHAACIVAYGLEDEDYRNYYRPIDQGRREIHEIPYDAEWIEEEYLPRLMYLSECLDAGKWPTEVFKSETDRNKGTTGRRTGKSKA